jgi:hypothetical protein
MDRPLWDELLNGVQDLGCGCIVVRDTDGAEFIVRDVHTKDDEVVIVVEEL